MRPVFSLWCRAFTQTTKSVVCRSRARFQGEARSGSKTKDRHPSPGPCLVVTHGEHSSATNTGADKNQTHCCESAVASHICNFLLRTNSFGRFFQEHTAHRGANSEPWVRLQARNAEGSCYRVITQPCSSSCAPGASNLGSIKLNMNSVTSKQ